MPLPPGTHLGPYEIMAPLGAGGMGEVYRARDTRLDRTIAIKILPAQFSSDPVRKQRFEREAKTISSLNHPHICVLHDVGSQDGVDYLVMECVEGETLAKRLEKGPLPLDQVVKFGGQMADVIQHADVRMIQAGNRFGFALEALLSNRIIRKLRRQDLDRHRAFQPRIPRAIHLAHAARAQRGDDLIRTKSVPSG